MSAILGIWRLDDAPLEPAHLANMASVLAHRGSDACGAWSSGPVGLAHRLLRTTPEDHSTRQPVVLDDGELAITADARLDNRAELVFLLGFVGRDRWEMTDTELILAAYREWGERCVEHLCGDFAFAIWDYRKQQLFCGRDPLGVRPFFYVHEPRRFFAFASEIKGILALPFVDLRINEAAVGLYLSAVYAGSNDTFYQGILRLPAGHSLTISRNTATLKRYWNPEEVEPLKLRSAEEYSEQFRQLLIQAVESRLRASCSVGSALSGGLDSSSIACIAGGMSAARGAPAFPVFSAVFPNSPPEDLRLLDERPFVQAVLGSGQFEAHSVSLDDVGPLEGIEQLHWHLEEPCPAANIYLHWALYRSARTAGVRVFLDGHNGDDAVGHGIERLEHLAGTGRWLTLQREAQAFSLQLPSRKHSWRSLAWQHGFHPLVPDWALSGARNLMRKDSVTESPSIVHPKLAASIDLPGKLADLAQAHAHRVRPRDRQARAVGSAAIAYSLEIANKTSAAFSIESRFPFCDQRLIEYCISAPLDQKFRNGWSRWLLRSGLHGILPEEVRWRPSKANLSGHFVRQLARDGQTLMAIVSAELEGALGEYLDPGQFTATYERFSSNPFAHLPDGVTLYQALSLALWLRPLDQNRSLNPVLADAH